MSRIRPHIRGSRLATAGIVAATATLLATAISPTAGADESPTRATAIENAAAALKDQAGSLG
ncbi:peptidase M4 family protein, partial [Streptomyces sp. NPDC006356]